MTMPLKGTTGLYTWTTVRELEWLAEQASMRMSVLEIGTYMGASAIAMAERLKPHGGKLVCVDVFEEAGSEEKAKANLREFIESGTVEVMAMDAGAAGERLAAEERRFDMVWIDDGHAYTDVVRDIDTALKVAAPQALICGHDFVGEVERAVRGMWAEVETGPDSIWRVQL